jgi:hypothetical protein
MKSKSNLHMRRFAFNNLPAILLSIVASAFIWSTDVVADVDLETSVSLAEVPMPESDKAKSGIRFEGILSADYNTHFVSYGRDIWGAGSGWSGDQVGTFNPWLNLTVATDLLQVYAGSWMDINSKGSMAQVGEKIQEFDVWAGFGLSPGRFRVGATYQQYFFLDQSDPVVDVWAAYSDYGQLFARFGFNPRTKLHVRDFGGATGTKKAILVGANPWLTLTPSMYFPFSLSLPIELVYFEKGFHWGDEGFGYWSIGSILHLPLTQKPDAALRWTATIGLTWFQTDKDIITTNPDENFIRGNFGIAVNF